MGRVFSEHTLAAVLLSVGVRLGFVYRFTMRGLGGGFLLRVSGRMVRGADTVQGSEGLSGMRKCSDSLMVATNAPVNP